MCSKKGHIEKISGVNPLILLKGVGVVECCPQTAKGYITLFYLPLHLAHLGPNL